MTLMPKQRRVATAFSLYALTMRSARVRQQLWDGADARYSQKRVRQLVVMINARQVEFAQTIVSSYRAERFSPVAGAVRHAGYVVEE